MSVFKPIDHRYLFLDMNSYFARCEQQLEPKLRHKPVVVAPYTGPSGCCIAVSYEAKFKGVKTGMGVAEAKQLIPELVVVESRPDLYLEIHHKLVQIIRDFSPWLLVKSIDEMAFPLSPSERTAQISQSIALSIKKRLHSELGEWLTASVGIGPNIFLAKQAAESRKPDGLVTMRLDEIPWYMAHWQLTDLKGINTGMDRRLRNIGIRSALEFYFAPPRQLRRHLGVVGDYWYYRLHGYPIDTMAMIKNKTIGQSCVLPPVARDWQAAWQVTRKLIERASARLRERALWAKGVYLSVNYLNRNYYSSHLRVQAFQDNFSFSQHIWRLWRRLPHFSNPVRVAITATELYSSNVRQMELFDDRKSPARKQQSLALSMDEVNAQFGATVLKPASMLGIDDLAPRRIPFGEPRY